MRATTFPPRPDLRARFPVECLGRGKPSHSSSLEPSLLLILGSVAFVWLLQKSLNHEPIFTPSKVRFAGGAGTRAWLREEASEFSAT